jgi:hypothetical protein
VRRVSASTHGHRRHLGDSQTRSYEESRPRHLRAGAPPRHGLLALRLVVHAPKGVAGSFRPGRRFSTGLPKFPLPSNRVGTNRVHHQDQPEAGPLGRLACSLVVAVICTVGVVALVTGFILEITTYGATQHTGEGLVFFGLVVNAVHSLVSGHYLRQLRREVQPSNDLD